MKIRAGIQIIILSAFLFIGCKKDKTLTNTDLLVGKTWVYDEYFRNFNLSTANLVFKRGKTNNSFDLSRNQVTFKSDGTYTEILETGQTLNGTWKFLNNETSIEVKNVAGTFTSNIQVLESDRFWWLDPIGSNGTFARMIPR